jgi:hypothetical protein
MNNVTINETCVCGAVLTVSAFSSYADKQQRMFHDAHARCRGAQVPPCELCGRPRNTHEHMSGEWDRWSADVIQRAKSI